MSVNKSFEDMIFKMETEHLVDFLNLDWKTISSFQYLSDDFMDRYFDKLKPATLCSSQRMSEELLRKHIDKLDDKSFKTLSNCQLFSLSYDFILEFKDKLDLPVIRKNKKFMLALYDYIKKNNLGKNRRHVSLLRLLSSNNLYSII